jgi:hypothetical protein
VDYHAPPSQPRVGIEGMEDQAKKNTNELENICIQTMGEAPASVNI